MSPMSCSQYLAPGKIEFDLIVMDEASQIRPEDALGAIIRAKQVVVVGDPKQLPPTAFFDRKFNENDDDLNNDKLTGFDQSLVDLFNSKIAIDNINKI
jgi:superfamily I DNA and/or RNA helicase